MQSLPASQLSVSTWAVHQQVQKAVGAAGPISPGGWHRPCPGALGRPAVSYGCLIGFLSLFLFSAEFKASKQRHCFRVSLSSSTLSPQLDEDPGGHCGNCEAPEPQPSLPTRAFPAGDPSPPRCSTRFSCGCRLNSEKAEKETRVCHRSLRLLQRFIPEERREAAGLQKGGLERGKSLVAVLTPVPQWRSSGCSQAWRHSQGRGGVRLHYEWRTGLAKPSLPRIHALCTVVPSRGTPCSPGLWVPGGARGCFL